MLRHAYNLTEMCLYTSLSAGCAFLARLIPELHTPILLLRLAIFIYCFWVIFKAEDNRILAMLIGSSLAIGLIGGNLDYLELLVRYDLAGLVGKLTTLIVFAALASFGWFTYKSSRRS